MLFTSKDLSAYLNNPSKHNGKSYDKLHITNKIHKLVKSVDVIPSNFINAPPNYFENISPKFHVAINTANIVPSIFFGQTLHAITNIGITFISVIV